MRLTDTQIIERANRYATRTEFKRHDDSAWRIAHARGMMDTLFPKNKKPEKPKREEWETIKPELTGPVKPVRQYRRMTPDFCREEAKKYCSLSQMQGSDMSLYMAISKLGLKGELFPVRQPSTMRNNCFYMARKDMAWFDGKPVFKVGVTSDHIGDSRIGNHALHARATLTSVIAPTPVVGKATELERYALSLGSNPGYTGFDGCTEYRAYSERDVQLIKEMVELCRQ